MPRAGWSALGAIATAAAIAEANDVPTATLIAAGTLIGLLVAAALRRSSVAALLAGVGCVAVRVAVIALIAGPVVTGHLTTRQEGRWSADVLSQGSTADGRQRAFLAVQAVDHPVDRPARDVTAYAWLPRYPPILAGDRLLFEGTLEPPPLDGSTFATYLAGRGARAVVRVDRFELAPATGALAGIGGLRELADRALGRLLPEPEAGLASGILVGRRDRVARDVADDFTTTGLSHVVAISGWNIALVGAVVGGSLLALGVPRRGRTLVMLLAVAAYTLLAGGGASVIRAAVMGGVVLIARETGRPGTAASGLGLAVTGLLLIEPSMVRDIGFQLSVAATAGLLAWGDRVAARLRGARPGRGRMWLAETLGVSLAAQAATLPLVVAQFGRLSLVAPLANLLVAPLVAPAMLVGVVALAGGLVALAGGPGAITAPFAVAGWALLGAMILIAATLADLPSASVTLPAPFDLAVAAASGLSVLAVVVADRRRAGRPGGGGQRGSAP